MKSSIPILCTRDEGLGLVSVGKTSSKLVNETKVLQAVGLFNRAMANSNFRAQLIIKLKGASEYIKKSTFANKEDRLAEFNKIIEHVSGL